MKCNININRIRSQALSGQRVESRMAVTSITRGNGALNGVCKRFIVCFMRMLRVVLVIAWTVLAAGQGVRHWTETETETIWRGRYKNCDYGYAVILPEGIVAHDSLPPSPNHGFLVSAREPGTTAQVTWVEPRIISVVNNYDAAEAGSARARLKQYRDKNEEVVETKDLTFKGLPAAYGHYRIKQGTGRVEKVELVIFRKGAGDLSDILYEINLTTHAEYFSQDSQLYSKIRDGFEVLPPPKGECSND